MKTEQMGPKMTATIKRFYEDLDFPDQGTFDYPDYPANELEDHLRPDRLEEDRYVIHETSYEVFEGNPSVAHGSSYKLKKKYDKYKFPQFPEDKDITPRMTTDQAKAFLNSLTSEGIRKSSNWRQPIFHIQRP
ncbi:uncharacterized protein FOBCDRAFT_236884 [Fusarium oxysporum Fo47]|uniref:Uncharacterized protein n=1 Tax=Fusarium oxysporum Fo47 TaxID=660027 RepID=W9KXE1_FUSOX|nr:uncharacterized protein FOBCDRAFT_236884 [Fusarium oxysporum Fo47]EWZ47429.1 hypothetical protein FOZG_03359 [Fusarium oxysporum Fo47]KAJ4275026.1 hypothetical protein NW764_010537 [Fusarium oxysporum]QKD49474.1 hypothetical protein FOBCDRAFT_236884 [Fusarium oxysporum Fo47]